MIWATVRSWSCFCGLYGASPSLAARNIISLISVLTIWRCPCAESSLALLGEGVCYDLTPKKRCCFHHRGLECKSRKSRDTWSNRQIWPWSTEWSRAKANRVLPRECTGHSKHPLPTTQEKTMHGHHQMVNTKIRLIKRPNQKMGQRAKQTFFQRRHTDG